jgi:microcystin-dependent protein
VGTPFLAEVKIISWNFPPKGWAFCNGQLMAINQNQALFSVLQTNYGGNGQTNFALPNLQGRVPIHTGGQIGAVPGSFGGEESHTLSPSEMPSHVHTLQGVSAAGTVELPSGNFLAQSGSQPYHSATSPAAMDPSSISNFGGSQPHENRQPFLVLNFVISLSGIFPSRN